jgi:DNA invertase Pin-like site-specific DNA recombinase
VNRIVNQAPHALPSPCRRHVHRRAQSPAPEACRRGSTGLIRRVSWINLVIKARIKQIEDELKQHDELSDELNRLRGALSRLEDQARTKTGRRTRRPETTPASASRPTRAAKSASSPRRAPRGQNKAKVLDALNGGPMTATEIAKITGIGTGTVTTMLTKMTKSGELAKAQRGYKLPD